MFKLAQQICFAGNPSRPNEDIVGWGDNYFFVIDGASCLSGINVMDTSDAAWMVNQVKLRLCEELDRDNGSDLADILKAVLEPLREEYLCALENAGVDIPGDSPSAGMALFVQRGSKVQFLGVGDCVGCVKSPDGVYFHTLDQNIVNLDDGVLETMARIHKETGKNVCDCREDVAEQLLINRKLKNEPGGYTALDLLLIDGLKNARRMEWEIGDDGLVVGGFSDGFAELADLYGVYEDYDRLFEAMQQNDLDQMFAHMVKIQNNDPYCNRYPRFKLRDDTSALWGVFTK